MNISNVDRGAHSAADEISEEEPHKGPGTILGPFAFAFQIV